ncbi:hypothetical protein [Levilactobacillus bambusae]|uniref:Uncharacterized protein n=1 Tax=Levilactobacillus bambusae TaxID=2024736 RepID=A0A2V1N3T5_9LACO|nr:hypothetical protein [Levilactobacillus bambusae]PWG00706.1 hypothetical protein DCM90_00590 [Levilactobacillus bambusae]
MNDLLNQILADVKSMSSGSTKTIQLTNVTDDHAGELIDRLSANVADADFDLDKDGTTNILHVRKH